jgi:hypothetical protein
MAHIKSACLALLILLSSCSKKKGDNWYETADESVVYSICFFKDSDGPGLKTRELFENKLERIEYLKCNGINIKIPKGYWYDDTKFLSSLGAKIRVSREELGITLNTINKDTLSSHFRPNLNIQINKIRWWNNYSDVSINDKNSFELGFMNVTLEVDKKSLTPTKEYGFNVYQTSANDSAIIYLPTPQSPAVFISCHRLYFKPPKIEPYKNRCTITSNIHGFLHINYMVYREDIPNIRNIHKSVSDFVAGLYKTKS